jgi:cleavage and polyadenylation specificity factor subunit 1
VQGEFVTRHSTGAPRPSRATCTCHRCLHFRHGHRAAKHVDNAWQLLTFSKLTLTQQKYSAYDRELVAVYEAVKHFRHMLEACHFIITDHKPITYAFQQKLEKCTWQQLNHLAFFARFTNDI